MGDQTAALTAALTEAIVAALQPLLQRTPWGDPLITEDSNKGGWVRGGAQCYGEEYFWLPPGQTPRKWREEHRQMHEQQQLYAKEVQPQPEPVENAVATTAAAAVLAAAALAAREEGIAAHKAELDVQQAVADEEAIVRIARAGAQPGQAAATAEWPELPATCVPPPTTPSRGEPGRRAQGRARAKGRQTVASLAAASTAAVAAAATIVVSVSGTPRAAASATDAALDHVESTAAACSGLGLIEQGGMVCLQRNDPLGLWGPVGVWGDEPCPQYDAVELQAAAADDAVAAPAELAAADMAAAKMAAAAAAAAGIAGMELAAADNAATSVSAAEDAAAGEEVFRGPVLSGPSFDLCQGPVLSGPGTDLLGVGGTSTARPQL